MINLVLAVSLAAVGVVLLLLACLGLHLSCGESEGNDGSLDVLLRGFLGVEGHHHVLGHLVPLSRFHAVDGLCCCGDALSAAEFY